jgi:hypothetical protein
MSESSEKSGEPKTFFGFNHTDKQIGKFTGDYISKGRSEGGGFLARLFHLGPRTDFIEFDLAGKRTATRVPQMLRHETPEPVLPEGKFRIDKKGRMHRIR